MNIREGNLNDVDIIAQYNYNLAKETEDKELDLEVVKSGVKRLIEDSSKGKYYVYTIDDEVVGQIMHTYEWSDWRDGTFLWIQSVYVHKDYRNKGVFKSLYNYVKEKCDTDKDIVGIRLYVEKENNTAKSTYKALGMDECEYFIYEYEK